MNQMSPGRMAGKPATGRTARKQGLEIAFDPDADPLAEVAGDPFAADAEAASAPTVDPSAEAGVRDGTVRRARGAAAAPAPDETAEGPGTEAPGQATREPSRRAEEARGEDEGTASLGRARHADPAEAARALGIPLPLAKIEVTVSVEVGRTRLSLADLVSVEPGELVALDRMTSAPVDVLVNGKPFARGEIVAIGDRFGVRLTELLEPGEIA